MIGRKHSQFLWTLHRLAFVLMMAATASASEQIDKGNILFEYYFHNDSSKGWDLSTLLSWPGYPDSPDESEWRTAFEGKTNWRNGYGTRVRGYLYPPQTGDYVLWIASDDWSQLWLSTDENPGNSVQIARVEGWVPSRDFDNANGTGGSLQKSTPIRLEAGVKYYIEAIVSEGGGGDNVAVAWQGPGVPTREIIDGQYLSPVIRPVDLMAGKPNPADGSVIAQTSVTLIWTAGLTAASHNVYVGDTYEAVAAGASETFQGNRPVASPWLLVGFGVHPFPDGLEPGKIYYWRVDEVEAGGTTHTGDVWSFTTSSSPWQPPENVVVRVTAEGKERELHLHKYSVRAGGFRVRLWHEGGYITVDPPEVCTYRGTVADEPNTRVCAAIALGGLISAHAHAGKTTIWFANNVDVSDQLGLSATNPIPAPADEQAPGQGTDEAVGDLFAPVEEPMGLRTLAEPPENGHVWRTTRPEGAIQRAQMAFEVSYERLLKSFGGDWLPALCLIERMVNRYDDFMARDVKMSFEITEVVVRMNPCYEMTLGALANHWRTEQKGLDWDYVGGLNTGGGGVAAVSGSYFVSAGVDRLFFHEHGHNLTAQHRDPGPDCTGGANQNDPAYFAPLNVERIITERKSRDNDFTDIAAKDYGEPVHPRATTDLASTLVNQPIDIDVLANDWDANDDPLTILWFTETTVPGGTVQLADGKLRYTPPQDYVGKDLIAYTVQDTSGLHNTDLVRIEVIDQGLSASWDFDVIDEEKGMAIDSSGHGHHVLLPPDYELVPGIAGNGVRIPAGKAAICDDPCSILPEAPAHWVKPRRLSYPMEEQASSFFDPMDRSFSLVFWFSPVTLDPNGTPARLFNKATQGDLADAHGYRTTADPNGIYFEVTEFSGLSKVKRLAWNQPVICGRWYHVAMIVNRESDTVTAWVNGERLADSVALTPASFICAYREDLMMGEGNGIDFDEVQIYSNALSDAEILAHFHER